MMKKEVYVVIAYKWGDNENHSYTVGVFDSKHKAIKCADSHRDYRGGKYACDVESLLLNEFDNESDDYVKDVYRAKSIRCDQD